jgi:hypothetical protein
MSMDPKAGSLNAFFLLTAHYLGDAKPRPHALSLAETHILVFSLFLTTVLDLLGCSSTDRAAPIAVIIALWSV